MTDDLSARLRDLLAEATPGPWTFVQKKPKDNYDASYTIDEIDVQDACYYPSAPPIGDARLIVTAINSLPTLLDRIDALQAEIERLRGQGERICAKCGLRHGRSSVAEGW